MGDGHNQGESSVPRIGDLVSAVSVVAAVCYGAGWLYYKALFDRLNLEPEDVGVDLEYLFVRAAVAIGVPLALLAALLVMSGFVNRVTRDQKSGSTQLWLTGAGIVFCAATFSLLFTTFRLQLEGVPALLAVIVSLVGAIVLTVIAAGCTLVGLGYEFNPTGTTLAERRPAYLAAVGVIAVAMLLGGSYLAGYQTGAAVAEGRPFNWYTLSIRYVEAVPLDSSIKLQDRCLLLLGSSEGSEVLYDPDLGLLHQVPTEQIQLSSKVNGCVDVEGNP